MADRSILLAVSSSFSDALDGTVLASIPFDRETIEWLKVRAGCFRKARGEYPDLYETYEFNYRVQWYDTSAGKEYDNHADRDKLERLVYDDGPFDDRLAQLEKLEACEIPWIVIPSEENSAPWCQLSAQMWPGQSVQARDGSPASLSRFMLEPFWVTKAGWPCKPGAHSCTQRN